LNGSYCILVTESDDIYADNEENYHWMWHIVPLLEMTILII